MIAGCEITKKTEYYNYIDFTLKNCQLAKEVQVGQFLHIDCEGSSYLRRPISVCDCDADEMRIVFQIKGQGTINLSKKRVGESVSVLGPLGHGFTLFEGKTVLVGGGLGSFPLLYASKILGKKSSAILGFRSKEAVYLDHDFEKYCSDVVVMTDDGSYGKKGFTTDALSEIISEADNVLCCGPEIMMSRVAKICADNSVSCQVSLEERMGCGIGTCLCCVREIKGEHLCVCKDGPVFFAEEVYK